MTKRIRCSALTRGVGGLLMLAATSLFACGVPEQNDTDTKQAEEALVTQDQSTDVKAVTYKCTGWDSGARFCLGKCRSSGWEKVGSYPKIPYGKCGETVLKHCGSKGMDDYCWGLTL